MEEVQIACSLGQDDFAARRSRWHALAEAAPVEVARTEHGLRLRFRGGEDAAHELHELAALERECSPFAEWRVSADGAVQVLDVMAKSEEALPAVQEMFRSLAAPAVSSRCEV
jgi:hypothetical protein